jgi:hypothetical protein
MFIVSAVSAPFDRLFFERAAYARRFPGLSGDLHGR